MSTVNPTNGTDYIAYSQGTGTSKANQEAGGEASFEQLLSEAIKELTNSQYTNAYNTAALSGTDLNNPLSGGFGMSGVMMTTATDSLEQAIVKATETGNNQDAVIALLMLMMIMETSSGGDSEMSMMMQMMSSMITQMEDKDTIRSDFMYNSYSSGGSPLLLDKIDEEVFNNEIPRNLPQLTLSDKAELPLEWWRPTTPAVISTMYDRSPENYRRVVDQFEVETAERYRPGREGNTYCNVYVWDVTRAMGAELPYYSDPETGAPREYPDIKGANYNGAKAMDRWLKTYGEQYGWRQVTAEEAQMHANQGRPAVTGAADVGHVQMVVPSADGSFDPVKGVTIAQAGAKNRNYTYISDIYGSATLKNKVTYWVHD